MPVIGCLEIFQNGRSPQPITGIIYSPGRHELKIGSAAEDTLGFIPLVYWPSGVIRMGSHYEKTSGIKPRVSSTAEPNLSSWGPAE